MPAGKRVGSTRRSTTDASPSTESPSAVDRSFEALESPLSEEIPISRESPCVGSSNVTFITLFLTFSCSVILILLLII